jgi:hypothetical protein
MTLDPSFFFALTGHVVAILKEESIQYFLEPILQ